MPKICYAPRRFQAAKRKVIEQVNVIIEEYTAKGLDLTSTQVFYQFVSRDLLPNTVKTRNYLTAVIAEGRLAGEIDWAAIEDRTRWTREATHWESPAEIIEAAAETYLIDKWKDQPHRVAVWIEKDALSSVFEDICDELDVPWMSCRGYDSLSHVWRDAMKFVNYIKRGQKVILLHFGDHDPSGMDMSRNVEDRIKLFLGHHVSNVGLDLDHLFEVRRIALTKDQVDQYTPPPNPAKKSDSRYKRYHAKHGDQSWELDALDPEVLIDLVRSAVMELRDEEQWAKSVEVEEEHRRQLRQIAESLEEEVEEDDERTSL